MTIKANSSETNNEETPRKGESAKGSKVDSKKIESNDDLDKVAKATVSPSPSSAKKEGPSGATNKKENRMLTSKKETPSAKVSKEETKATRKENYQENASLAHYTKPELPFSTEKDNMKIEASLLNKKEGELLSSNKKEQSPLAIKNERTKTDLSSFKNKNDHLKKDNSLSNKKGVTTKLDLFSEGIKESKIYVHNASKKKKIKKIKLKSKNH